MDLVGGTVVAGRFRLVSELGHGGMGAVWLASDTSLDTPCAIKFIIGQAANDPQMRARFEREAKSAAQLRSPNVVQILDHGVSDGVPYIAMELLEGEDLDHRLQRVGRLSPHETVYIMSQVAKALMRANAAGLVHRDLKPANIFLVRDEDRDIPKVLDFGVAKSSMPELADSSTKTGALMGTPYYMSPEQTRGIKALDHRSDLWALAVIVFQCVTGRLPFISDSLGDLLFKIGTDPLPVPTQVASDVPPTFDQWWLRAAQRDPANRFQTAKEFVDALAMSFGMAQTGGFSASGRISSGVSSGSGNFHAPGSPSGGSSPSWGSSQGSGQLAAAPVGPVLGAAPSMTGVTANSVAEKPQPKRSGLGLLIGVAGVVVIGGAVTYSVVARRSPAAPERTSDSPAAVPEPSSAAPVSPPPTASPSTAPAPVVIPTATATMEAHVPPAESASAPKPTSKSVPGVKPKPTATAVAAPPPPPTKIVPNDGI